MVRLGAPSQSEHIGNFYFHQCCHFHFFSDNFPFSSCTVNTGAPTGGTSTPRGSSRSSADRHNHFMEQVLMMMVMMMVMVMVMVMVCL